MGVSGGIDFAQAWQQADVLPTRLRMVRSMAWRDFATEVAAGAEHFVHTLVGSLLLGDVWLLKGAFPAPFLHELKAKSAAWMRSRPASFHQMLEGSPDFHRVIDPEAGRRYAFRCCKHSAYFYRWNDDPLGVWPMVTERWRVVKRAMGLAPDAYERFTPKDGVVDRVQVVRYPPSIGYLEPHADPHLHQRVFLSAYMSKRGVDFHGGGFYAVNELDQPVFVEDLIDVGDIAIGCSTVVHGVAPVDAGRHADWASDDGRWFLSLYSNASDEVKDRHTGRPARLEIPGVTPWT